MTKVVAAENSTVFGPLCFILVSLTFTLYVFYCLHRFLEVQVILRVKIGHTKQWFPLMLFCIFVTRLFINCQWTIHDTCYFFVCFVTVVIICNL